MNIKSIFVLMTLLFLRGVIPAFGQENCPERNISTNPDDPVNEANPGSMTGILTGKLQQLQTLQTELKELKRSDMNDVMLRNVVLLVLLVLLVFACREEEEPCQDPALPECENYDPCYGVKEVQANIKIYNSPTAGDLNPAWEIEDISVVGDSCYAGSIVFEAEDMGEGAIYTWQLGSETITKRTFSRSSFPLGETISVSLTVERDPNRSCFPDDDGLDTTTRYFHTLEGGTPPKYIGRYRGALSKAPNDSFDIQIALRDSLPWGGWSPSDVTIYDFLNEGCELYPISWHPEAGLHVSYHQFMCFGASRGYQQTIEQCTAPSILYIKIYGEDLDFLLHDRHTQDTLRYSGVKIQ